MKKLFYLCLFLLLYGVVFGAPRAEAAPVLSNVFMASGVNSDGGPRERVTVYPPETPLLAAFAECRNATVGMRVRFVWFIAPPGQEKILFAEYEVKSPLRQETAIFHSTVSIEKEWPETEYVVEVSLDGGKTTKTVRFSVKKGAEPTAEKSGGEEKKSLTTQGKKDECEAVYWSEKDAAREKEERGSMEKKLAEKESAFQKKPSDFLTVLELADAYAGMNDVASASLALALYKGLAESSPSDMILARLADAYARLSLYDQAFTTALRRTWNPLVSQEGAISQILLLATASGDWDRGIDCLRHILAGREGAREETLSALAALYIEKAGTVPEKALREEYRSAAAGCLDEVEASLPSLPGVAETILQLRKEIEEL